MTMPLRTLPLAGGDRADPVAVRRRALMVAACGWCVAPASLAGGLRSPLEMAQRLLALVAVLLAVSDAPRARAWVKQHELDGVLSPRERSFLAARQPAPRDRVAMSWRIEAAVPLLWALRKMAVLPSFLEVAGPETQLLIDPLVASPATLMQGLVSRPPLELLQAQAEAMHAHWRLRDAQIHGRPAPLVLNADVVVERHYALNWIVRDQDRDWDLVETNT